MIQNTNNKIVALVFSKDRAMQLDATLRSFFMHCTDADSITLFVLYKSTDESSERQYEKLKSEFKNVTFLSETDFKQQSLKIIALGRFILFMVDDNIFIRNFRITDTTNALSYNLDAIGFSLRLGTNTDYCYMKQTPQTLPVFQPCLPGILKYNWPDASQDFAYPLEVSSSVYRTAEILPLMTQLDFQNPNILEGLMAANSKLFAGHRPAILCFEKSVTFCNPVNMVQQVSQNRAGSENKYSPDNLARMFDESIRIDITQYSGFTSHSCHQEVQLFFKKPNIIQSNQCQLVSIEMVTYNAEKFIKQAIESVLAQTWKDLELLIVDDGSTDSTPQIVQSFSDSRIRYIFQPHSNAATARNSAVNQARGRFILCVDSDDFIAPNYVEKMINYAQNNPGFDFYYPSTLTLVDNNGKLTSQQWQYMDFSNNSLLPAFLFANAFSPIPNPGSLIRKDLYQKTGPYEDLDTVEDFVFLCRNALKIKFKKVDSQSTYFYRTGSGLSHRFEKRNLITARTLREMVLQYSPEQLCPDILNIANPASRQQQYLKYLMMTFSKHTQNNKDRFGEHFQYYCDFFRAELIRSLLTSDSFQDSGLKQRQTASDTYSNAV